ncbi:MAG: hypothetical protein HKO87_09235 [Acidimicrobiia bacterium]|nr:hypothetical protein [Acidimicrobiia bacterium]
MAGCRSIRRVIVAVFVASCLIVPDGLAAQEDATETVFGFGPTVQSPLDDRVDPAITFGYSEIGLVPVPEFDFAELHDSGVFAAGVDWIEVDDDRLVDYEAPHLRARQVHATVLRDLDALTERISFLRPRVQALSDEIAYEHAQETRLAAEIDTYKMAIAEFAVRAFIGDEDLAEALAVPNSDAPENRVLADEVRQGQFAQIDARENEIARRRAYRGRLEHDRYTLRRQIRGLQHARLDRLEDERELTRLIERTASEYRTALHDRLPRMVRGTDLPLVALNAYVIAERTMAIERPRCDLRWWMLAGVGKIESAHGHFGDSTLDTNGRATVAITGPALDGRILEGAEFLTAGTPPPEPTTATTDLPVAPPAATGGEASGDGGDAAGAGGEPVEEPVIRRLALIADTDDGVLDGDSRYDRAVGPMQFIPQTWRTYETDGNHDDLMEPQNIYDAALASARYLCTAAGSMASEAGLDRAYFAYNHDEAYTEAVKAAAYAYRRRLGIPDAGESPTSPLGLAEIPADDVSRTVSDAVLALDLSGLPDW